VRLPPVAERGRTAADALVETLTAFGVTHVFGMVGHSNLGFADAMRRAEERGELTYVGIRHEGAAAFAASAYGKLTGRPAACFAIAGPGSTNMLTGLYDAKLDQSPVLAISGQVPSREIGRGAFQDLDLSAVFSDVAAWTATVRAHSDPAELAALAVKHAIDARGVAHLVLPDEVQTQPSTAAAQQPTGRIAGRRVPLGSIGFGYPAALGASVAAPGRPIVAVTGDGGFGQYAAELTTAVKYNIAIKHVLLDNHSLGKISKEQLAADFPVWHTSLHNPDWAAYAELCGATGIKATGRDQLDDAMTRLFAAHGPALLHIEQDAELL
jgi:pyruvate oxidase